MRATHSKPGGDRSCAPAWERSPGRSGVGYGPAPWDAGRYIPGWPNRRRSRANDGPLPLGQDSVGDAGDVGFFGER